MRSSLPSGIFVRAWESRLDLLRVLIIGPRDTPYELAPFVIDFHFADDFPENPPKAHFHSWTDGRGRINPNLYEDGTICISLLGTWPGDEKDTWSAKGSTMLQIIVSLLGLVLVQEPYFSKPNPPLLSRHGPPPHDDLSAFGSSLAFPVANDVNSQLPYYNMSETHSPAPVLQSRNVPTVERYRL